MTLTHYEVELQLADALAHQIVTTFTTRTGLQQRRGNTLQQKAQDCLKHAAEKFIARGSTTCDSAPAYKEFQNALAAYGPLTGIGSW
jgi:hypothetical protein